MTERNIEIVVKRRCPNQVLLAHGKFHVLLRAIFFAAATGIALAILSGCTAQVITRAGELLAARKAESLKGWETATLDGRPLMESLGARVAMLITNFGSVSVEIQDSALSVQGDRRGGGGIGSAVPISDDGYFLTATHVIDDAETLHLVVGLSKVDGRTRAEGIPARVVWKSEVAFWADEDWSPGGPLSVTDIAIIHAELDSLPPTAPFRLAGKAPQDGEPVIIAGWSLINIDDLHEGARFAAGKIVSVLSMDARGALPAFVTLHHDTPVAGGDSGGPLLDRSGNLIGITSTSPVTSILPRHRPGKLEDMGYIATATMPDPNWLWEVIDNDRLQRNAGAATSPPLSGGGSD